MITIDIAHFARTFAKIVLILVCEFIVYGFVLITFDSDSEPWERAIGTIEIVLFIVSMFLIMW